MPRAVPGLVRKACLRRLRRHFARPHSLGGGLRLRAELRQAKVQNLRLPTLGDEDIGGLDVPVDKTFRVCGLEGVSKLDAEVQKLVQLEWLGGNSVLQRLTFQVLHDNERLALVFADIINSADVRVVKGRGGSSFPLKALQGLMIPGQVRGQELEGHETAETGVLGLVHHSHPAPTQLLDDAIVPKSLTDHGNNPSLQ